jgi:hypothetical protein
MKKRFYPILAALGGLLLWGCYPQGPDYIEELDVVITNYNPDYNFSSVGTYAMPDRIVKITGNVSEGESPEYIPDVTANSILGRIEDNLNALGWTRVDDVTDTANIDVLVLPAAWETTTIYYYYDYWYWWYGGYYPYWGYGYYPPVSYSSYTTGTLLWAVIDPKDIGGTGNPIREWTAAVNGILTYSFSASRVNAAIDKAFDQSPYLSE